MTDRFDSLLAEIPRIAEAVKALPEGLQVYAFDALVAEFRGNVASAKSTDSTKRVGTRRNQPPAVKTVDDRSRSGRRRVAGTSTVRDLDLTPAGKQSFVDFVDKKRPQTQNDKNAVSVYWLCEVLGLEHVSVAHVLTCYRDMRWREPGNLANSLALTANRKRFLDTASLDDIKLTPAGRNHVLHDLPVAKQASNA